jgi:hypothetical protein
MSCVSSAYEWTEHLRPADLVRAQQKVNITKQIGQYFGVAIGIYDGPIVNQELFVTACQCQRQNCAPDTFRSALLRHRDIVSAR